MINTQPPSPPVLAAETVHVWLVELQQPAALRSSLWPLLHADEQARALRFHFQRDRERFIVARGVLRVLLGGYLGHNPGTLTFSYNQYGKPALAGPGSLCFNLSHAHDMALIAITEGREVGVDIEYIRPEFAGLAVAERFFSAHEIAALLALPAAQQTIGFFNCWTRKEAYIKAHGAGLSLPLDQFDVTLAPDLPAALLATHNDPDDAARWKLLALNTPPGYVAALVAEGQHWQVEQLHWQALGL